MSVKLTEIVSKIVVEEDPALARFRRFDTALAGVQTQDRGRHVQESRGFVQVECAHGRLLPVIVVHPDVVAAGLGAGLAFQVFGKADVLCGLGRIEKRLQGVEKLPQAFV